MMTDPLLKVSGLRTHYYRPGATPLRSVDGVDLTVMPGEVVALVGESGCGKSTTAMSIMGLIGKPGKIVGGTIEFAGTDLVNLSPAEMRKLRGRALSIVFQNPNTYLNPVMRVGDQIAESAAQHLGINRREALRRAIEVLEQVRVTAPERVARSYPYELSGGMNQRVLIAIAIVCQPNLIILDEPTTALDVMVQREILGLLRRLKESRERSMIFITHDFGLVAELADRVYVMYAGRVVEHGDVFQIFSAPRHPYTQALMKSVPSMTEIVDSLQSIDGSVPDLGSTIPGCLFAPRCKQVLDRCRTEAPVMERASDGSGVACWRAA